MPPRRRRWPSGRWLTWHERFSRFRDDSELTRLNADGHAKVAVGPLMRRMLEVGLRAARDTGGLVDFTLADDIERARLRRPHGRRRDRA